MTDREITSGDGSGGQLMLIHVLHVSESAQGSCIRAEMSPLLHVDMRKHNCIVNPSTGTYNSYNSIHKTKTVNAAYP